MTERWRQNFKFHIHNIKLYKLSIDLESMYAYCNTN